MSTVDTSAFAADWADARGKFLQAARHAGAAWREWPHPLKGPGGEALAVDTAWLGPRDAPRVLVLVAGTHGVEGFCGSGPQVGLLRGDASLPLPRDTALLLLHGINPHGWAWLRRVTEEGVDLNRNWVDFAQPLPENPGYAALHEHLLPRSLDAEAVARANAGIADHGARHGAQALQVAMTGGQYTHPEGLIYGGASPTWARRTCETLLAEHLRHARQVVVVDVHSGLGPYGYGEPVCFHAPDSEPMRRARAWWGDSVTEPRRGTSTSYAQWGLADTGFAACVPHAELTYLFLEFGTYPMATGLAALRGDHWLHAHGDPRGPEAGPLKAAIRDFFYPPHEDWKELVLFRTWQVWRQALAGLAKV